LKLSVQLTRDLNGNLSIAVESRLEELVRFNIVGVYDAVAIFQSMVMLAKRIEDLIKEDKS